MLDVKMSQAQLAATSVTEMQVFLCTCVVRTLDYILALGQKNGPGLGPRNWSEKAHPKLTPLWRPTQLPLACMHVMCEQQQVPRHNTVNMCLLILDTRHLPDVKPIV